MKTFKAYVYKEHIESRKQARYILLAVGILLFAILDPVMLKLMPMIIKSQANVEIPANAINTTSALSNYIKDLHQIGFLFILFSFAGTLAGEIKNQKLMIPYSKGAIPREIVLAKVAHYFIAVFLLTVVGFIVNYFNVWYLFGQPQKPIWELFQPLIVINIYYWAYLSLALLLSSLMKKTASIGILVLLFSFFLSIVAQLWIKGKPYFPESLIEAAYQYDAMKAGWSIVVSLAFATIMILASIFRMNKVEVN